MMFFNGRQHIDLQNIGPFGGMYLPYNLPAYFTTGDPDKAASVEMQHPMMKKMYGWMFKVYGGGTGARRIEIELTDRHMIYL